MSKEIVLRQVFNNFCDLQQVALLDRPFGNSRQRLISYQIIIAAVTDNSQLLHHIGRDPGHDRQIECAIRAKCFAMKIFG
jgi:hypothetical protein